MINMTNLFPYSNRKQENKKLFEEGKTTTGFCRWFWFKIVSALLAISISTFSFSASADTQYSVAGAVIEQILSNIPPTPTGPVVSVSAAYTSVNEDFGRVRFTFSKTSDGTLTSFKYRITESGDFLRYKTFWSTDKTVTDGDGVWTTKSSTGATIDNDNDTAPMTKILLVVSKFVGYDGFQTLRLSDCL